MKKLIIVIATLCGCLFYYSCKENTSNKTSIEAFGKSAVLNGKDEIDSLEYYCIGCEGKIKSTTTLQNIISYASQKTKNKLIYPLSFIPKKIQLLPIQADSLFYYESNKKIENVVKVFINYKYIGKNGFGNELEGESDFIIYMKNEKIIEIENEIRLDSLKYVGDNINRNLLLESSIDNGSIYLMPMKDKSIIVLSSIGCIDEGTCLLITLENNEEIKLVSWNEYNCEGRSFFHNFKKDQIKLLKESKLKSICKYP